MGRSLKSKTLRALFWGFFELAGQQGMQLVVWVILARLLFPEEFGLVAMLTIFMALGQTFINSGFGQALIQKKDVTYIDECSIFYFNILVGFLATGFLSFAAPWIAEFYKQPLLINITRAMSLVFIINAFGLVQTTLLSKKLDFRTQSKVSLIATLVAGTIGIAMAYRGHGVWSLVVYSLSRNAFRTLLLWFFHHWRPAWVFSFASLRAMFAFSSKLLCSGLLETIFQNIYLLVIGRLFSATDLGFYSQANRTQQLPASGISSVVSRVAFPVFSSIHDDRARLKRGVHKALTVLMMFNVPMMVGLAVVAKPLILVLFTEKWLPCMLYLQLLCVVGMLHPLHVINLNVLMAQGRSDLFFRLEVLKKILVVVSVAITYRWGITALILGQIVVSCLGFYLNSYYTGKFIGYSSIEQIRDIMPSAILASITGVGVYSLSVVSFPNPLTQLVVQVISGIGLYVVLCRVFRLESFMEAVALARPKLVAMLRELNFPFREDLNDRTK